MERICEIIDVHIRELRGVLIGSMISLHVQVCRNIIIAAIIESLETTALIIYILAVADHWRVRPEVINLCLIA